jgi:hypothetical protein
MKHIFSIMAVFVLAGCNAVNNIKSTVSTAVNTPAPKTVEHKNGDVTVKQSFQTSALQVKNYNQYNMTLAKLTGINQSNYNTLFDSLKGSLPADNDVNGLTPFNLVSMTRLADAYCKDFVERESTAGLKGDLYPLNINDIREFFFDRFLDVGEDDESFASLKVEVDHILKNEDGTGSALFPGHTADLQGGKNLASAACTVILASPYITLLQ